MFWILQHQDLVPPGRYARLLDERQVAWQCCRLHEGDSLPKLQTGDGVLVLGGTMGAYEEERYPWLEPLKEWMQEATAGGWPLLTICLGAQLLAAALGGAVHARRHAERGVCRIQLADAALDDPLFSGVARAFPALQWHNDSFDPPADAQLLASSNVCPHQAFRYRNAYALQFHPEVEATIVVGWNALLKRPGEYVGEFVAAQGDWQPTWDRLFENFLVLCGSIKKTD
ncbi:MAG: fused gamma-glutamyl-gamma-aminobutyrate hydrolase/peptidase [Desulfuromonas sp.]|nr:MAG: fused gamma-glutamyl-gamma-aminobutyrate hydrolase/peptidase [Desulfuromonas sp.]